MSKMQKIKQLKTKFLLDCIVNLNSLDKEIKGSIRVAFYNVLKAEKNQRKICL